MRLVPSLVAGLLATVVAASCTLPSSDEFSRGGPPSEGKSLGGSSGGPTVDGGEPTLAADGATTRDATSDGEAGARCTADFCYDFAASSSVADYSTDTETLNGTLAIEDGQLHAATEAAPGGARPTATITRELSASTRKAVIELDLRVDHGDFTGLGGSASVLAVSVIASKYSDVELYVGGTYSHVTSLRGDGSYVADETAPNILRSTNVHVRLAVNFDPTQGSYELSFDGRVAASRSGFDFGNPGDARFRVSLGIAPVNPPCPSFDVRYDNLTVDLQ